MKYAVICKSYRADFLRRLYRIKLNGCAAMIVRRSLRSVRKGKTNWRRVDRLTDRDIERAIRNDPDAAPILDEEWFRKAVLVLPTTRRGIPKPFSGIHRTRSRQLRKRP
jgi:hypothetical protein